MATTVDVLSFIGAPENQIDALTVRGVLGSRAEHRRYLAVYQAWLGQLHRLLSQRYGKDWNRCCFAGQLTVELEPEVEAVFREFQEWCMEVQRGNVAFRELVR